MSEVSSSSTRAFAMQAWWQRHWQWCVPVALVTAVVGLSGCIVGVLALVMTTVKSSAVYTEAVAHARSHPAVIQTLGEPIHEGWWISGHMETNAASGSADVAIPIAGPRGSGMIYAVAEKSAGRWHFSTLAVDVGVPPRIDLLHME